MWHLPTRLHLIKVSFICFSCEIEINPCLEQAYIIERKWQWHPGGREQVVTFRKMNN